MHQPQVSRLELTFRERAGKTYLAEQFVSSPLKVLRPFDLGEGCALLHIINVGPGVLGGDRYALDIRVISGAQVVLVNQSATKLHPGLANTAAEQTITFHVEAGANLFYNPGLTIPFRDTDFSQRISVHLEKGARFGMLERWSMGRTAMGEAFAFRRLSSRVHVSRAGRLVYADGLELTPSLATSLAVTEGYLYLAMGVWFGADWPIDTDANMEAGHTVLKPSFGESALVSGFIGGYSEQGFYLRAAAHDSFKLMEKLRGAVPLELY